MNKILQEFMIQAVGPGGNWGEGKKWQAKRNQLSVHCFPSAIYTALSFGSGNALV